VGSYSGREQEAFRTRFFREAHCRWIGWSRLTRHKRPGQGRLFERRRRSCAGQGLAPACLHTGGRGIKTLIAHTTVQFRGGAAPETRERSSSRSATVIKTASLRSDHADWPHRDLDAASAAVPVGAGGRSGDTGNVAKCRKRLARPRISAAMTTSSSLGRPTARRCQNRFACAPPHERCRPGSGFPAGSLLASSSAQRTGTSGTEVAGRQVPAPTGSGAKLARHGGVPLSPPPQIGGKRTAPRSRGWAWICPFSRQRR
jgi:hypothetical protein